MLSFADVNVSYGAGLVLHSVNLEILPGEIVVLLGANGAGKTTTLKTISGLLKPVSGKICFLGEDVTGANPASMVTRKVVHVPEGRQLFLHMTVKENLEVAGYAQKMTRREIAEELEKVLEIFPSLKARLGYFAGSLSGGEQQMVAIGRGIMAKPKILLLDEPSLGLAPLLVNVVFDIIAQINKSGTTVLLVEQNASMALNIAHRGYVLENGKIILHGKASDLLENNEVKKAYLGIA